MKRLGTSFLLAWMFLCSNSWVYGAPAFPGAEGYGAVATGGRGGAVYEVTNLADSGTGSLRAAVQASGARTVVFRVSGTIILSSELKISNPNITIAGQTAPGDGICIRRYPLVIAADNVIIRYIRVRFGDESGTDSDAVSGRYKNNIILDHVSASWSVDEAMSIYHCSNVTIQWCLISESLFHSNHVKEDHGYGGIWGSNNSTHHHNLLAHHSSRNPRFSSGSGNTDYRNNVIYNWGFNSAYGGEDQQVGDPTRYFSNINMVANYYKPGPATSSGSVTYRIANPSYRDVKTDYGSWYIAGNYMVGNTTVTNDNWNGGVQPQGGTGDIPLLKSTTPFPVATTYPLTQQTAQVAYSYVLNSVGCSIVRDSVDTRIISEVTNGNATYEGIYETVHSVPDPSKKCGIIDSQTTVGGWPTLNSTTAPTDGDHDGMPDTWETANGLSPSNAADRNYYTLSTDYTNLEVYINSLCPNPYDTDLIPPSPNPTTWATFPYAVGYDTITMTATTATDASGVEYRFVCTYGPGHSSAWQDSETYTDTGLIPGTYAYTVTARDKSPAHNTTGTSIQKAAIVNAPPDVTAPSPDPMTWSVAPHGESPSSISMTATTATDASGVEYYFTCTAGSGHDSGWQDATTYVDIGLAETATCSYTVKARDKSPAQNETSPSTPDASASALADSTAPTPDPMTFEVAPAATGTSTITMTATTAYDDLGVEYFFANITDASHDSGWQDGTTYIDTGLINNTTYTYRVIARDKSLGQNETAWSDPNSATTLRYLCTGPIATDLNGDCRTEMLDYAILGQKWLEPLPLTDDMVVNGTFDTDITPGWEWLQLPTATGVCYPGFDGPPYGNPPGAGYLLCEMAMGDVYGGHFFYQVIPVTPGQQYRFSGEWMGDLVSTYSPDANSISNHAEVVITFEAGTDPAGWGWTSPNSVMYRKSWGIDSQHTDPNGTWDWEPITASLTNGPADGIFTATAEYMVVAFSMGGITSPTIPWIDFDNIKVEGPGCPVLDLNDDCSLDLLDLAAFAEEWLACNRLPSGECLTQ